MMLDFHESSAIPFSFLVFPDIHGGGARARGVFVKKVPTYDIVLHFDIRILTKSVFADLPAALLGGTRT